MSHCSVLLRTKRHQIIQPPTVTVGRELKQWSTEYTDELQSYWQGVMGRRLEGLGLALCWELRMVEQAVLTITEENSSEI